MRVLGITFVGTATPQRNQMVTFAKEVLGLPWHPVEDVEADLFRLPDGSTFAVASPGGMGPTERTIGFLVADLDEAIAMLEAAGTPAGPIATNSESRYTHFVAPDGQLYELAEAIT